MAFEAGTRLGPYEIIAPLGAGGMGEVYRARDTRLDRTVAIKVLTDALAADSESRQRFEHEARAIAALNDPRICTIHDVGRHGELDYLVLEYLEGETLADRLGRSPALPLDDALAIAIQIGDALARAHRAGIVHRDLKPGNVMLVRRGGTSDPPDVKLLDFGLAARSAVARPQALDASLAATTAPSHVATRRPAMTAPSGFSGTVQYMPPKQLDGEAGDHRADIFAFGCVLYEMLAGCKAFEGGSTITVIAAIMSAEPPPIAALQSAHPLLDHVLRRCLEKDRERRWQSIGDVTGELRWIVDHPMPAEVTAVPPARRNRFAKMAITVALVVATAVVAAGVRALRGRGAAPDIPTLRFEITTTPTDDPSTALSPDGTEIAFVANQDRVPVLWVLVFLQRAGDNDIWVIELARNLARRVTDGPPADGQPLWDPDGQHVVFNSQRFGRSGPTRQAVSGGKAEPLFANGENGLALSWTRDRRYILIRRDSAKSGADLVAVAASGEPREVVVAQSQYDETEGQFSPDGRWIAFVSNESGRPEVFVQSFPEAQARTQVSTAGGTQVRWSSDGKEIFYVAPDGRMMAVPIAFGGASPDVKLPVPLFQTHLATGTNVIGNKPQYAVSRDGRFLLNTAIESASAPIVVSVNWMKRRANVR